MNKGEFSAFATPVLSAIADALGLKPPKRVRSLGSDRIRGAVDERGVELSASFWAPDPAGGFFPSPFMVSEMFMVGEDEALAQELASEELEPFPYWSYSIKYKGSAKSLGYSRWKGPPTGFIFPDATFVADSVNEKRTSLTVRLVGKLLLGC